VRCVLVNKHIRISFIGDGSHAKRIKNSLKRQKIQFETVDFDRKKNLSIQDSVLACDAIFITSPNNTHANYLAEVNKFFKGYVYCEKPPINRLDEIKIYDSLDYRRFFFGFNFRYSPLVDFINKAKKNFDLGSPINLSIHVSYPFAIKKAYLESWKSNKKSSPNGVIENLAIHYIDFALNIFGIFRTISLVKNNISKNGKVADTASLFFEHINKSTTEIFVSYSSSVQERISITFENGDIHFDGNHLELYYPRDTFGHDGLAQTPPKVFFKEYNNDENYDYSLDRCLFEFITKVQSLQDFDKVLYDNSRRATMAMFGIL